MDTKIFNDRYLTAKVECTQDCCFFTLRDLSTGHEWPKVPVLALEIYDRAQQRMERFTKFRIDQVEAVQGGAHIVVGDRTRGIEVGLWLRLVEGELSVQLSPAEV